MSDPNDLEPSAETTPPDTALPSTTTTITHPGTQVVVDTAQLASQLSKNIVKTLEPSEGTSDPGPEVKFKLVYNKQNFEIVLGENQSVRELKDHIESLTKLPRSMQKLMFKGRAVVYTQINKELC